MKISIRVVDTAYQVLMSAECGIDEVGLVEIAESRRPLIASKGQKFAEGMVAAMGREMLIAFNESTPAEDLQMAATNTALAIWLHDSEFNGLSADEFFGSDLVFVLLPGGGVKMHRTPRGLL